MNDVNVTVPSALQSAMARGRGWGGTAPRANCRRSVEKLHFVQVPHPLLYPLQLIKTISLLMFRENMEICYFDLGQQRARVWSHEFSAHVH